MTETNGEFWDSEIFRFVRKRREGYLLEISSRNGMRSIGFFPRKMHRFQFSIENQTQSDFDPHWCDFVINSALVIDHKRRNLTTRKKNRRKINRSNVFSLSTICLHHTINVHQKNASFHLKCILCSSIALKSLSLSPFAAISLLNASERECTDAHMLFTNHTLTVPMCEFILQPHTKQLVQLVQYSCYAVQIEQL